MAETCSQPRRRVRIVRSLIHHVFGKTRKKHEEQLKALGLNQSRVSEIPSGETKETCTEHWAWFLSSQRTTPRADHSSSWLDQINRNRSLRPTNGVKGKDSITKDHSSKNQSATYPDLDTQKQAGVIEISWSMMLCIKKSRLLFSRDPLVAVWLTMAGRIGSS